MNDIGDLSEKNEELSKSVHEIETQLAVVKERQKNGNLAGGMVAAVVLGFLGYTSFISIPSQVKNSFNADIAGQIDQYVEDNKNKVDAVEKQAQEAHDHILGVKQNSDDLLAKVQTVHEQISDLPIYDVPIGTIISYLGPPPQASTGWLICDGRIVARQDYPRLHETLDRVGLADRVVFTDPERGEVLGFSLPDLQGVFLRGVDPSQSRDKASRAIGSIQDDAIRSHGHDVVDGGHSHVIPWGQPTAAGAQVHERSNVSSGESPPPVTRNSRSNVSIKNSGGPETRPVNVAVLFLIKAKGASISP